ncbi:cytochrome P450 2D18 [Aaosphaeria arxii CBS 175.79]|uniref:Cytochrome P450 2D18 n=1 Tax=Aaosphaeria arxii CBS 175.79 TaxID=1450172 RepID=A0A6A5Y6F2_9PLEO|nr:cytochrome P450 2D18 [Aaosphaeria arxii CBS 175.79]KAF2021108.1 cytochrome P450 2D18 [Aaosphaeria arxii CBS 175.79]
MFLANVFGLISLSCGLYLLYSLLRFGHRDKRLPPGPPTVPILGNAHQIPPTRFYLKIKEWADKYGGVYSLKIGAGTMIIINDRKAAHELFEKRSAIYSDRPIDHNLETCFGSQNIAIMHATPLWRAQRKISSQSLAPKQLDSKIKPIQEAEMSQLMFDLLMTPDEFFTHVKRSTASIASIVLFGYRAPTFDSFWANAVYQAMDHISPASEPGASLPIDQFPILKLIPDRWAPSKARAKLCYEEVTKVWIKARDLVEERRRNGDERDCLADRMMSGSIKSDIPLSDIELANFLGALSQGAADTTMSAMMTSILYLATSPWVQEKARVELDSVCGVERMPLWEDFDRIPYINCIIKEGLRVNPVIMTGIPHRAARDDWYEGMLIPKDSAVLISPYAMNYSIVDDPEVYNPDRYLNHPRLAMDYAGSPDYEKRDHYTYGGGRRICAGIHLAERTQWRMTARILWAFKIEPAIDPVTGKPIELDTSDYIQGLISIPSPFRVNFVPRSEKHAEVIRKDFNSVEGFLKQWE